MYFIISISFSLNRRIFYEVKNLYDFYFRVKMTMKKVREFFIFYLITNEYCYLFKKLWFMFVTTNVIENFNNKKKFLNTSGKEIDILQIYNFASNIKEHFFVEHYSVFSKIFRISNIDSSFLLQSYAISFE